MSFMCPFIRVSCIERLRMTPTAGDDTVDMFSATLVWLAAPRTAHIDFETKTAA